MPISLRKRPPPPPPRCCFDDPRVRKPAILPSFRREFHFHFPPPPQPPPIPSKEHDLWMHHHHHHFSSLPLLNYQKKERKKAGFVSEVSAVAAPCLLATFSSPPYPCSVHPTRCGDQRSRTSLTIKLSSPWAITLQRATAKPLPSLPDTIPLPSSSASPWKISLVN